MMNGATFGERHSYWAWGLLTKSNPVVSPPEPKTNVVEVPGSDRVIDLTESLTGKVHYRLRTITCPYVLLGDPEKQESVHTEILNYLHGKRLNIVLDTDSEYYYTGRVKVSKWEPGQFSANITLEATVEPYKTARFITGKKVL